MVTDPVCFTELDPDDARARTVFRGRTYYFHSPRCREVFRSDPGVVQRLLCRRQCGENLDLSCPAEELSIVTGD